MMSCLSAIAAPAEEGPLIVIDCISTTFPGWFVSLSNSKVIWSPAPMPGCVLVPLLATTEVSTGAASCAPQLPAESSAALADAADDRSELFRLADVRTATDSAPTRVCPRGPIPAMLPILTVSVSDAVHVPVYALPRDELNATTASSSALVDTAGMLVAALNLTVIISPLPRPS